MKIEEVIKKFSISKILPTKDENHFFWSMSIWVCSLLLALLVFIFILYLILFKTPSFEELENPNYALASIIFDDKGDEIGKYFVENREKLYFDSINPILVKALIAEEDIRFFDHSGIDYRALGRVVFKTLIKGQKQSGGGSTITQQLAKLLYKRPLLKDLDTWKAKKQLIIVKMTEWITAVKLEHTYTKEEIISIYLNKFEFINGAHGLITASQTYFGKDQKSLNAGEIALLVGMLQNPSFYNPVRFPHRARIRRNEVLTKMAQNNIIPTVVADSLKTKELVIGYYNRQKPTVGPAPYFRNEITKIIINLLKEEGIRKPDGSAYNVFTDGLKIYSTLDLEYQQEAEKALKDQMSKIQERYWEVWKNKDPLTYQTNEKTIKQRSDQFWKHIRNSDRYIALRKINLVPHLKDYAIADVYIEKMIETEENKKDITHFIHSITSIKSIQKEIIKMLNAKEWPNIKKAYKSHIAIVNDIFNKKVPMTVFDHLAKRKDMFMSPKDSVMYHLQHMQAGLLALDPKTGYVKAWVGGLDYDYFKFDHCTSYRQIGSTVKPFVYATAMQYKGIKPCTYYLDIPYTIKPREGKFTINSEWKPDNATETFTGNPYNLYHGLLYSKNSITVKLMKEIGDAQPVRDMLQNVGMDIDKKLSTGSLAVPNLPAICLGAIDATLFDMVGAYTVFVNNGIYSKPQIIKQIVDREGRVIYQGYSPKNKAMDPLTASITLDMLENNCSREWKFNFESKAGGKTGTTNDYVDGWFMGVTPNLVVGVWCGGDERFIRFTTLDDGQGFTTARPLFQKFIQNVEKNISSFNTKASFPKKHPQLKENTNCSHYKIIFPNEERSLRRLAAENPEKRDSIMRLLSVN